MQIKEITFHNEHFETDAYAKATVDGNNIRVDFHRGKKPSFETFSIRPDDLTEIATCADFLANNLGGFMASYYDVLKAMADGVPKSYFSRDSQPKKKKKGKRNA